MSLVVAVNIVTTILARHAKDPNTIIKISDEPVWYNDEAEEAPAPGAALAARFRCPRFLLCTAHNFEVMFKKSEVREGVVDKTGRLKGPSQRTQPSNKQRTRAWGDHASHK